MNDLDLNTLNSEEINRDAINRLETKVNTRFEKLEESNAELKSMLQQLLQQSSIAPEQNSNSSGSISGITTTSHGQTTTQTAPTTTTAITQDNATHSSMTSATQLPRVNHDFWDLDTQDKMKTLAKHAEHGAQTLLDVFSTEDNVPLHHMLKNSLPDYAEKYTISMSRDLNERREC